MLLLVLFVKCQFYLRLNASHETTVQTCLICGQQVGLQLLWVLDLPVVGFALLGTSSQTPTEPRVCYGSC